MLRKALTSLTLAVALTALCSCNLAPSATVGKPDDNPQGAKPEENRLYAGLETWLSTSPGYHFVKSSVTEGKYQGQPTWIIDYQFMAKNGFGMDIPAHVLVYMKDGTILHCDQPISYAQEQMAKAEKERQAYADHLTIKMDTPQRDGSYVHVYGTVTNNNAVALKSVEVKVAGYNSAKEIVDDSICFVASGEYLKPGQTGHFAATIKDEGEEIVSVESSIAPIYKWDVVKPSSDKP